MVSVIMETTLVVPSEETPKGKLCLSNLDQSVPPAYTCTLFHYKNNGARDFFSIEVLKDALAKTLVHYYPLAGRLLISEGNRQVVECNAEGLLLVVARSDCSSDDINFQPSPELRSQFIPSTESPSRLCMLQITYLKCGGVVLGTANNHVLVDGRSAFHFFRTWSSIARGDLKNIIVPSFDNAPIAARCPPSITYDHTEYEHDQFNHKSIPISCVTTKFELSNKLISSLKSRCKEGGITTSASTFCVVASLVWKCFCIAQELPPDIETRLFFTADICNRVHPPLPENFFGNAIVRKFAISQVSKVTSNPIHIVANTVKAAVDGITEEFIRSFIDYVEVNKDKGLPHVKQWPKSVLRISNISRMPVYHTDFGWGGPQLMTWAQAQGNVVSIKPGRDSGVDVSVSLDSAVIQNFEKLFREELCF